MCLTPHTEKRGNSIKASLAAWSCWFCLYNSLMAARATSVELMVLDDLAVRVV